MVTERRQQARQAVVLIHGIGEQRPMDTLRSFMAGVGLTGFYSKPDRLSENFELRRFSVGSSSSRPPTDCYEFYWAHHLEAGRILDTAAWAGRLLVRRPFWRHGRQLRTAFAVVQIASVALIAVVVWAVADAVRDGGLSAGWQWLRSAIAVTAVVVNLVAGRYLTRYLADAARYLSPTPDNVEARNAIRAEGLRLLRSLHDAGTYQRVVLVGHSLGSVIGLDLLRLAWDDLRHPDPSLPQGQDEVGTFESQLAQFSKDPTEEQVASWQKAQHRLWRDGRERGVRWLVTDFVTVGSPLAHASFLLDGRTVSFRQRQREREYPTCPPELDKEAVFYSGRYTLADGTPRNALVAHHGAPFAVTRWSNAYFPVRGWYGDPVGGPLAAEFGPGVRDVAVRTTALRARTRAGLFLAAHGRYWRHDSEPTDPSTMDASIKTRRRALDKSSRTRVAHLVLVELLQLDTERSRTPYPAPPPPRDETGVTSLD